MMSRINRFLPRQSRRFGDFTRITSRLGTASSVPVDGPWTNLNPYGTGTEWSTRSFVNASDSAWRQDYRADGVNPIAGKGADILHGTDRSDRLEGHAGNDKLYAGAGDDQLDGGLGSDHLDGGAGNDLLVGGAGKDRLHGGDGDDFLDGGESHDRLYGRNGNDILWAGDGHDLLEGGNGDDTLEGGNGEDKLYGSVGHDLLRGGADNEVLEAGRGNDTLEGGTGDDKLKGGDGHDLLVGDAGADRLEGGQGNDVYRFDSGFGQDTVDNADAAGHDEIRFGQASGGLANHLWFSRAANDLQVTVVNRLQAPDNGPDPQSTEPDKITIAGWYEHPKSRVDLFRSADGQSLTAGQVDNLVNAMAAFGPPPAGSESLSPQQWSTLDTVIAANWA